MLAADCYVTALLENLSVLLEVLYIDLHLCAEALKKAGNQGLGMAKKFWIKEVPYTCRYVTQSAKRGLIALHTPNTGLTVGVISGNSHTHSGVMINQTWIFGKYWPRFRLVRYSQIKLRVTKHVQLERLSDPFTQTGSHILVDILSFLFFDSNNYFHFFVYFFLMQLWPLLIYTALQLCKKLLCLNPITTESAGEKPKCARL